MSSHSPCYLSGPNDVWSLGIILVNLTCGRNPWKRASVEDSTFRAYLKNPKFLSTILPLTPELDSILRRVFECDPRRRIQIPELRNLILRCPKFTTNSDPSPLSPTSEVGCKEDSFEVYSSIDPPVYHYAPTSYPPCPVRPNQARVVQYSRQTVSSSGSSSSDEESLRSASSTSSTSSYANDSTEEPKVLESTYVPPKPKGNFYGHFIPLDPTPKNLATNPYFHSVQVC